MTISEQIAQVVREISGDCATHIREVETPEDQDTATETVCAMRTLAKMIAGMDFEEAKATILEFEQPYKDMVVEALSNRGIFL